MKPFPPGTHILLFGTDGHSGKAVTELARQEGWQITGFDDSPSGDSNFPVLTHRDDLRNLITKGSESRPAYAVVSPGFPLSRPEIEDVRVADIPITGELNLGLAYFSQSPKIGITGTDGKSSITSFISQILTALGCRAVACGNFGLPLCEMARSADQYRDAILVVEMSSYQLEQSEGLSFNGAVWTNFADDHLDRYPTRADYFLAKLNLPRRVAAGGFFLYGAGSVTPFDDRTRAMWDDLEAFAKSYHISVGPAPETVSWQGQTIADPHPSKIVSANLATALAAVEHFLKDAQSRIDIGVLSRILKSVEHLPHRQQIAGTVKGIRFINDSKASTMQAVGAALDSFDGRIHLLIGGKSKNTDFGSLKPRLRPEVIVYTFGEAGPQACRQLELDGGMVFATMEEAVQAAYARAKSGDSILLSPGGTSWDAFKSYAQRGEVFCELVRKIEENENNKE